MSSNEGAFIVSKNTSKGKGSPCAADLTNKSACSFTPLGIFLQKILQKRLPTFGLHLDTFQALGLLPYNFYPYEIQENINNDYILATSHSINIS
jgi:hypothetical protein